VTAVKPKAPPDPVREEFFHRSCNATRAATIQGQEVAMHTNNKGSARIDEIAPNIYRSCIPIPASSGLPDGFALEHGGQPS
jgi:hypothetical protein